MQNCTSLEKVLLTDRRATHSKNSIFLSRRKSCTWFALNWPEILQLEFIAYNNLHFGCQVQLAPQQFHSS